MKILQVIPAFYPAHAYGGSVEVAYHISKELVRRGHEVTVYTSDSLDKYHRQKSSVSEIDGIKVYYFKTLNNRLAWNRLIFTPGILPQLSREMNSFDIVHLHSHYTFLNIATHYYARKFHIPYVLQAHTSVATYFQKGAQKRIFDKLWGYRIIRDARKLIAVSKEESEHYKQMGVAGERISVIYNGMDIESFKNLPKYGRFRKKYSINGTMILYLGRIHKSKGIDIAIKAFFKLIKEIDDDIVFVIAGSDDGYKTELERLIKKLNLSDRVMFMGFVDEDDKMSVYVDADLFVHTVLYMGGVGLTPLEAILCDTPVIVTDECGEVVNEANCGYLVEYGDIEGLKEKMKWVILNPEGGEEMVERGKRYIEENLTWDKVVERVEAVYEGCIESE